MPESPADKTMLAQSQTRLPLNGRRRARQVRLVRKGARRPGGGGGCPSGGRAYAGRAMIPPLPSIMVEPSVRAALLEDLGRAGDLTTDAIVPASARTECALVARQAVEAGLQVEQLSPRLLVVESGVLEGHADPPPDDPPSTY